VRGAAGPTFDALRVPNFRLYFLGQGVSLVGTWMQTVTLAWLVLELTGSGTALGLVAAAQFLPVLVLAPYGGLLADRSDKRRLLMATQTMLGAIGIALGALTLTGAVRLWMVVALAAAFGLVTALDNPGRQSFAVEMVGPDRLRNAVSLNSVLVNVARALGPAVAGVLILTAGTGVCFLVNGVSYAAVLVALARMDVGALRPAPLAARGAGQVRAGLRYVARTPELFAPLAMIALVGTLAYEFPVVLPLMARDVLGGGAGAYGLMTSAMGAGAVAGGLLAARRAAVGLRPFSLAAGALAGAMAVTAFAPSLPVALAALVVVGAASVTFLAIGNTTLQLASHPSFRGRVMALWSMAFIGSTPVGAPILGAVSEHLSPRAGLGLGAVACLAAAGLGAAALARARRRALYEPGGQASTTLAPRTSRRKLRVARSRCSSSVAQAPAITTTSKPRRWASMAVSRTHISVAIPASSSRRARRAWRTRSKGVRSKAE
jgi:MFS family permease